MENRGLRPAVCSWFLALPATKVLLTLPPIHGPTNHSRLARVFGHYPTYSRYTVSSARGIDHEGEQILPAAVPCLSKRVFLCCNRAVIEASFARHCKHSCRLTLTAVLGHDNGSRCLERTSNKCGGSEFCAAEHHSIALPLRLFTAVVIPGIRKRVNQPNNSLGSPTGSRQPYTLLPPSPWQLLSPRAYPLLTVTCAHSCASTFSPVFGFGTERYKR